MRPADGHGAYSGGTTAMPEKPQPRWLNWRAAIILGLFSSSFSSLVDSLAAARVGRDAFVDWMVVAAIPLGDPALQAEPRWWAIVVGVAFHQWADFSWDLVFFGLFGRWTAQLNPWTLLLVAAPWAAFTSGVEWLFLVPVLPFRQPIFTLEQPYWLGLVVHATATSTYPLFPWIRARLAGSPDPDSLRFAAAWAGIGGAGTLALGLLWVLGATKHEIPIMGGRDAYDQSYMRKILPHHGRGFAVGRMGIARARDPHLRALARLM